MVELQPILKKAYWSLAAAGLAYVSILFSMTYPDVQRFALYAHKANPAIWQDVNDVENFGFLKTQVQPFTLVTADNVTLYGWHILPLQLCRENEAVLTENVSEGPADDYTTTTAYKLLANDPNARVIVNFHGNAGHLGSATRPEIYRQYLGLSTPSNPVHVFAIDYRGFGISGGHPTEEGVITDGVTLVNFLTSGSPYAISPSRIVLVGQSLGTAVTSAVAERFALGAGAKKSAVVQPALADPEPFAGVVLVASFSNLAKLIDSYSMKGLTPPILSPLVGYPRAQNYLRESIVDKWDTAGRVARLTGVNTNMSSLYDIDDEKEQAEEALKRHSSKALDLTIIHARNDVEIPWREGQRVWLAATAQSGDSKAGDDGDRGKIVYERAVKDGFSEVKVWEKPVVNGPGESREVKKVRWEKVGYGGHNLVATYSVATLAVLRAFEE